MLSLTRAGLLFRAWGVSRSRLLLWSGLGFALLALSNVLLFIDLAVIGDETDLRWARSAAFLAGTATLLGGLIWDAIGGARAVIEFLDGASCLACAAVAMVFLRSWRLGGDRLLLLFGLAFVVQAVNRIGLAVLDDDSEAGTFVYLARARLRPDPRGDRRQEPRPLVSRMTRSRNSFVGTELAPTR